MSAVITLVTNTPEPLTPTPTPPTPMAMEPASTAALMVCAEVAAWVRSPVTVIEESLT